MNRAPLRLAVLASGRGSNLAAILAACTGRRLDATVVGVFSDKSKAGAITIARAALIPATVISPSSFDTRAEYDEALLRSVDALHPDLIVCAGFMRVLSAEVVAPRSQRMINVHPSLLPRYAGLQTHQRAIDAGDAEHGASVHFVIPALDAGPVIAQTRIAIAAGDDAQSLAARLLPAEHRLLVGAIALFAAHSVRHKDGAVFIDDVAQTMPQRL